MFLHLGYVRSRLDLALHLSIWIALPSKREYLKRQDQGVQIHEVAFCLNRERTQHSFVSLYLTAEVLNQRPIGLPFSTPEVFTGACLLHKAMKPVNGEWT